ncbi:hypothetical protein [Mucilaginibacter sp. L3T2-6]|uniref:hypothetical protein n=1 Tax=Mucilaginibacter sp. L3T2-6 TaxID=3062491 RepID=UPI0026753F5F|nr:hypothetical protein [Mucilaginibacter sp. L3T2-6]MDO3641732.1 hypothetical protein [Mucilaginibacter sp. L3T2-6]MDV6214226.1 hypothetical protein [Mucilaginibacter sp. L3T2-6]
MKKILFNISVLAAIAFVFSACHPMNKTYEAIGPVPTPSGTPQTFSITLATSDYAYLPTSNYAKTTLSFKTKDDAAASIPVILAAKYPNYANKSSANVTYNFSPVTIKLADSVFANVAYTLTDDDYLLLPNNKYTDFSASQILKWLPYKYPDASPNQLALLTFNYYESGVQSVQTQSFLFLNGIWVKIYTISQAQYQSVGKGGTFNDFSSSDAANLPNYFNTFLKADPAVTALAKVGDVQYVSYKYFGSGVTSQRVLPLTFNGTNWITTSTTATLTFALTSGTWIADNTVNYTLTSADYTYIATQTTTGTADSRSDLGKYGDFTITGNGSSVWSDADVQAAIIALLKHLYPAAAVNQKFVMTYKAYNGATVTLVKTFQYNGTTFVQI